VERPLAGARRTRSPVDVTEDERADVVVGVVPPGAGIGEDGGLVASVRSPFEPALEGSEADSLLFEGVQGRVVARRGFGEPADLPRRLVVLAGVDVLVDPDVLDVVDPFDVADPRVGVAGLDPASAPLTSVVGAAIRNTSSSRSPTRRPSEAFASVPKTARAVLGQVGLGRDDEPEALAVGRLLVFLVLAQVRDVRAAALGLADSDRSNVTDGEPRQPHAWPQRRPLDDPPLARVHEEVATGTRERVVAVDRPVRRHPEPEAGSSVSPSQA